MRPGGGARPPSEGDRNHRGVPLQSPDRSVFVQSTCRIPFFYTIPNSMNRPMMLQMFRDSCSRRSDSRANGIEIGRSSIPTIFRVRSLGGKDSSER